jgi:phosphoserine phosphatase
MKPDTIIWDFDGTILPSDPYDSEQTLLLHLLHRTQDRLSLLKRIVARAAIYADRKEWLGGSFKKYYLWVLKGTGCDAIESVAQELAAKISHADRQTFVELKQNGYHMMILSCGTLDLIEKTVQFADLAECFDIMPGNRFVFSADRITGMDYRLMCPHDKLEVLKAHGISAAQTIAVGDGYTDLPLLKQAALPILIDRTGEKKRKFSNTGYCLISSIPEMVEAIAVNLK